MNNIYITVSIIAIITIILFSAFSKKGGKIKKENKNEDTLSQIQMNEDTLFVFSPSYFPKLACLLEYKNKKVKCKYYYKPYRIFKTPYGHLIVKKNSISFPQYIILNSTRIPIHIPYQGNAKYNLEMCLCLFFNYTAVNRFIQVIEAYRLLGVDHFTVYIVNASASVMKVMNYYQSIDVMEVVLGNRTVNYHKYIYSKAFGQLGKGDDCIYRNMRRSKKVIIADQDEIIWPVKHKTINEMLESINGSYNYFSFRSFQFHTDVSTNNDVTDTDIFLYHEYCRYRQGWVQKNIYTKLDAIYSIFIHWLMDGTKEIKQIYPSYELVYIRHTRRLRYLKESACETNWTLMAIDPREKVINDYTKKIRNLLHIKPPLHVKPIILKDISSPLSR